MTDSLLRIGMSMLSNFFIDYKYFYFWFFLKQMSQIRRSGLQTEVINFYRKCFRAVRKKPIVNFQFSKV